MSPFPFTRTRRDKAQHHETDVELYLATFEDLFALSSHPTSPFHIRSIWLIEHANHGESSLLNEDILKKHFSGKCKHPSIIHRSRAYRVPAVPMSYYAAGVEEFLRSGLVNLHDPYLVPVAHCGGGGGL